MSDESMKDMGKRMIRDLTGRFGFEEVSEEEVQNWAGKDYGPERPFRGLGNMVISNNAFGPVGTTIDNVPLTYNWGERVGTAKVVVGEFGLLRITADIESEIVSDNILTGFRQGFVTALNATVEVKEAMPGDMDPFGPVKTTTQQIDKAKEKEAEEIRRKQNIMAILLGFVPTGNEDLILGEPLPEDREKLNPAEVPSVVRSFLAWSIRLQAVGEQIDRLYTISQEEVLAVKHIYRNGHTGRPADIHGDELNQVRVATNPYPVGSVNWWRFLYGLEQLNALPVQEEETLSMFTPGDLSRQQAYWDGKEAYLKGEGLVPRNFRFEPLPIRPKIVKEGTIQSWGLGLGPNPFAQMAKEFLIPPADEDVEDLTIGLTVEPEEVVDIVEEGGELIINAAAQETFSKSGIAYTRIYSWRLQDPMVVPTSVIDYYRKLHGDLSEAALLDLVVVRGGLIPSEDDPALD